VKGRGVNGQRGRVKGRMSKMKGGENHGKGEGRGWRETDEKVSRTEKIQTK
jgi:hypothetical protein